MLYMGNKQKNKKNYKQFHITKLEDGLVALGSLIAGVTVNLKKYKTYSEEVYALVKKYYSDSIDNSEDILIPADEYENINDKLLYRQREILKFISDSQKSSLSYIDLRKSLVKSKHLSSQLDQNLSAVLNEFLDIRNWTFHNPQSLMVASSEVAEKTMPKELQGIVKIKPQINPLIITHTLNYDFLMLASLSLHVEQRIKKFDLVLEKMKEDYNEMYQKIENKPFYLSGPIDTSQAIFHERYITHRLRDSSNDVVQISMAIQKSKYDGLSKTFNKWAINKIDVENETDEGTEK